MKPRLLLVEDEPGVVLALTDRLQADGYDVAVARDGEAGLLRASVEAFDLVLLDAMLPRRNGFDVLRELRARGVGTPVLMLTARGQVSDKVRGLKLGADDYVTKPFDNAELLARIAARLRPASTGTTGPAAPPRAPVAVRDVTIDVRAAEVRKGGRTVDLSPREFHLLRYFVDHRGATLSRSELLQHVWGYDADVSTRTVDVHVAWLRRKLEDDPRNPQLITTVHGMGYRLEG
ncbi:MAG TPA: response regulator transcription factor [Vicinamibacteria bacterium]|nr:response regulator transcription factor [Vicinamibacteria bacterium]